MSDLLLLFLAFTLEMLSMRSSKHLIVRMVLKKMSDAPAKETHESMKNMIFAIKLETRNIPKNI